MVQHTVSTKRMVSQSSKVTLWWILCISPFHCLAHKQGLINSFVPLACAECDDSLPFSGASSIPFCYVIFPATLLYQLFFHPLSPHLAIYFLVYLLIFLFPNSYIVSFWEFSFLPFSVHAQSNVIYLPYCPYYSGFFNTCVNFCIV